MIDPSKITGNIQAFTITIDTSVTTGTGAERVRGTLSGFRALMVLIDNFTNQYIYEVGSSTWVPPNTQGYRIVFPVATAVVDIYINTPPGVTAATRANGQIAVIKYLENPVITSSVTQQITAVANTSVDGTLINVAATITNIASTTQNASGIAATANLRLVGWAITENAAAAARLVLHHGTTSAGAEIADIQLLSGESNREFWGTDGIGVPNGVFIRWVSGTFKVDLFTKTVA